MEAPREILSTINLMKMLLSRWWIRRASLVVDPQNVNVYFVDKKLSAWGLSSAKQRSPRRW